MNDLSDWQSRCGILKIVQTDRYGCGVACLAMVTGTSYVHARDQFIEIGYGVKRSGRPPYSTSSREMQYALARSGLIMESRRWKGWASFHGLGVMKMKDDWRGANGRWHWAVAFRHREFGITIFDPHQNEPSFSIMPDDVLCLNFDIYEPKGEWFQIEQRITLER